ncbi:hypothetical protein PSHT_03052 [Puccinia striiformis]|uniref:40S ribosomal protein S15 n=1 Tax=Puccinia striiformis TaxID=27350 RepID=A0A2S4WGF9_9BASI|nr:hypothetical protein PSHT_03052 [Puccinia striiformis]
MSGVEFTDPQEAADLKKRRTFRKFQYRGIELEALLDLSNEQLMEVVHARARRRFQRGLKRKPMTLIKKLRKARKEAPPNEKPAVDQNPSPRHACCARDDWKRYRRWSLFIPTLRRSSPLTSDLLIYNGKTFNSVEIKGEMVGHYLAEFSISYKPVKHGRPGIGATHSSRFIPLK